MISDFLRREIRRTLGELYSETATSVFSITPESRFGDYTTNVAMVVASATGINPRDVAETIVSEFAKNQEINNDVSKIEIAGPGFINFFLTDETLAGELNELKKGLANGYDFLAGKKVNIEFISANPTGALHIGHGRNAFFGDALANVLSFSGAKIEREYYVNDSKESKQIIELGKTALGVGEQYKTPTLEELVKGDNFTGLSENEAGFKLAWRVNEQNKKFIEEKLSIKFDTWYSEEEKLQMSGQNKKTLNRLEEKGLIYENDGAVWLKTSKYGDEEDRVLVRTDGTYTYFLSDISYHADKFERGYNEVMDIWGADHHGHVKRVLAVKKMLDWSGELKVFITQLVSLKENGESAKMSKRAGNVILLEDLVDEFGLDVVRWFFNEKSLNTHMDFDMALAREHSAKNPVFYVQYAHARICSIAEKAKNVPSDGSSMADAVKEKAGRALAVKLAEFPEVISVVANDCQVHKLTTYAYELAHSFSQFYENVRMVGSDTHNKGALALALTSKEVLAKSLGLLGISAPNKM